MMMRASTPSKIHSHRSDDAGLLLAAVGLAAAAGLCPAGRFGRGTPGTALWPALLMAPVHPVPSRRAAGAAPVSPRHPVRRRIGAARASLLKKCPANTRQALCRRKCRTSPAAGDLNESGQAPQRVLVGGAGE